MSASRPPYSVLSAARSGVYRSPAHADAVRSACGPDDHWIEIDLGSVGTKEELLDAFARAADFPASFGRNWDALADALQDLSWLPAGGYAIRLVDAARAAQALGFEWSTFIEVLRQTAAYWKTRGKAFVVFVDDASELPLWM